MCSRNACGASRRARTCDRRVGPQRRAVELDRLEDVAEIGQGRLDLGLRQRRPAGQVGDRRRAVAGEEAVHQRPHRVVTVQGAVGATRSSMSGVGVVGPAERARADQAAQLGQHEHVPDGLAPIRAGPTVGERRADLGPRHGGAGQRDAQRLVRPFDHGRVDAELTVPRRHRRDDLGRRQPEDPAEVLGSDEVPRRAQDVGAQDVPVVDGRPHTGVVARAPAARAPSGPADRPAPGRTSAVGRRRRGRRTAARSTAGSTAAG